MKDSPTDVFESKMGMSPWGRTDLHFAMTHSLGLKTATEQRGVLLDTEQHIFKPWAGYTLKSSLSIIHICMVTPSVGGVAGTVATLLDAETHLLHAPGPTCAGQTCTSVPAC